MSSTGNILDVAGDSERRLDGIAGQRNEREIPVSGEIRSLRHLDVADQGNATSVRIGSLCVGAEGVSSAQANPQGSSDSQYQGLLIERLIGSVERAEEHAELLEQLRLEEEAAAEEGAAIEASGYSDPAENVRFA